MANDVIVISSNGENLGSMPFFKARQLANDEGLDLIEVAKQQSNTVFRIGDKGKWVYEQKKKKKAQQHNHHVHKAKEMKFSMRIEAHDQQTKIDHIKTFVDKGYDVRIIVEMQGREKAHPGLAVEKMKTILSSIPNIRHDEPKRSSGSIMVNIHPDKKGSNDAK